MAGQITNVRWFSRALTAAEVQGLHREYVAEQLRAKPPAGAKINPDHPLSRGLVCAELFNERT